jgi:uncharacterized protein (DUF427 family)
MEESVWDYPRPPRVESDPRRIVVKHGDLILADTTRSVRVLETSHPPAFYLPVEDVAVEHLTRSRYRTFCEYKGAAHYWDVTAGEPVPNAAWGYARPSAGYEALAGRLAFYPAPFACTVGGEPVLAQEGGFYGGWITPEITGPFKGDSGTAGW